MELLRQSALLFRMHFGSIARSKRALVSLLLVAAPPVIGFLVVKFEDSDNIDELMAALGTMLLLQVITPLISLIVGSAAVTEEVENRTITYVFTRPIHRAALFLGRWFATVALVSSLLVASAAALVFVCGAGTGEVPAGMGPRLVIAAGVGGAVYSTIFALIGVFLRRPMILGLGYAFALEFLIANIPGSAQTLSVQFYLRSIYVQKELEVWVDGPEFLVVEELFEPRLAALRLATTILIALVVGSVGITRKQFVLTS